MTGPYVFLAIADMIGVVALVAVLGRLLNDYARGTLTSRTLLVGGMFTASIVGLLFAGIQTLALGPVH